MAQVVGELKELVQAQDIELLHLRLQIASLDECADGEVDLIMEYEQLHTKMSDELLEKQVVIDTLDNQLQVQTDSALISMQRNAVSDAPVTNDIGVSTDSMISEDVDVVMLAVPVHVEEVMCNIHDTVENGPHIVDRKMNDPLHLVLLKKLNEEYCMEVERLNGEVASLSKSNLQMKASNLQQSDEICRISELLACSDDMFSTTVVADGGVVTSGVVCANAEMAETEQLRCELRDMTTRLAQHGDTITTLEHRLEVTQAETSSMFNEKQYQFYSRDMETTNLDSVNKGLQSRLNDYEEREIDMSVVLQEHVQHIFILEEELKSANGAKVVNIVSESSSQSRNLNCRIEQLELDVLEQTCLIEQLGHDVQKYKDLVEFEQRAHSETFKDKVLCVESLGHQLKQQCQYYDSHIEELKRHIVMLEERLTFSEGKSASSSATENISGFNANNAALLQTGISGGAEGVVSSPLDSSERAVEHSEQDDTIATLREVNHGHQKDLRRLKLFIDQQEQEIMVLYDKVFELQNCAPVDVGSSGLDIVKSEDFNESTVDRYTEDVPQSNVAAQDCFNSRDWSLGFLKPSLVHASVQCEETGSRDTDGSSDTIGAALDIDEVNPEADVHEVGSQCFGGMHSEQSAPANTTSDAIDSSSKILEIVRSNHKLLLSVCKQKDSVPTGEANMDTSEVELHSLLTESTIIPSPCVQNSEFDHCLDDLRGMSLQDLHLGAGSDSNESHQREDIALEPELPGNIPSGGNIKMNNTSPEYIWSLCLLLTEQKHEVELCLAEASGLNAELRHRSEDLSVQLALERERFSMHEAELGSRLQQSDEHQERHWTIVVENLQTVIDHLSEEKLALVALFKEWGDKFVAKMTTNDSSDAGHYTASGALSVSIGGESAVTVDNTTGFPYHTHSRVGLVKPGTDVEDTLDVDSSCVDISHNPLGVDYHRKYRHSIDACRRYQKLNRHQQLCIFALRYVCISLF